MAIAIAERWGGEIVSADSRLVYRGMDIGTAKPSVADRVRVPHHLIDIIAPDEPYDLACWQADAAAVIADIVARGALPVVVGGTAQWTTALLDGWQPPAVPPDDAFRAAMEARLLMEGVAPMLRELAALDPAAAEMTGPNPRRIIRALEVIRATGEPFSVQRVHTSRPYRDLRIALTVPRAELYRRIDLRVEMMLAAGLVAEVRGLLAAGYALTLPAMSGIGYRQTVEYIGGGQTFDILKERIIHATHRYARHQTTWLRRDDTRIEVDATDPTAAQTEVSRLVAAHVKEHI